MNKDKQKQYNAQYTCHTCHRDGLLVAAVDLNLCRQVKDKWCLRVGYHYYLLTIYLTILDNNNNNVPLSPDDPEAGAVRREPGRGGAARLQARHRAVSRAAALH